MQPRISPSWNSPWLTESPTDPIAERLCEDLHRRDVVHEYCIHQHLDLDGSRKLNITDAKAGHQLVAVEWHVLDPNHVSGTHYSYIWAKHLTDRLYKLVTKRKGLNTSVRNRRNSKARVRIHRLVLTLCLGHTLKNAEGEISEGHHINVDGLDNRVENLEPLPPREHALRHRGTYVVWHRYKDPELTETRELKIESEQGTPAWSEEVRPDFDDEPPESDEPERFEVMIMTPQEREAQRAWLTNWAARYEAEAQALRDRIGLAA